LLLVRVKKSRLQVATPVSHRTVLMSAVIPQLLSQPVSKMPGVSRSARPLALARAAAAVVLVAALPAPVRAQSAATPDSTGFLIKLGADTLAIERVVTYADSVTGDFLTRSPHTSRYTYTAHVSPAPERLVTAYAMSHYQTGLTSSTVDVRLTADFASDSAHVIVQRKDSSHAFSFPAPSTTVPLLEPGFGLHQILIARALAGHDRRLPFAWVYVPDQVDTGSILAGPGANAVEIATPTDTIRAVLDAKGRVLSMTDPGGTFQATVSRIPWPDLDHWAADFMDRDAKGRGLGTLSTRDTVRAAVGLVKVLVDYSRPAARGRQIFGNIVPWNVVWRTGANWATSITFDKDLLIGPKRVPAGSYTLFTIPSQAGWTLIVSRATGEWGTEYDPTADFARIPMTSATTPRVAERFTIAVTSHGSGKSNALTMQWDNVIATVPLRVAVGD
jgi:hypothetical protein